MVEEVKHAEDQEAAQTLDGGEEDLVTPWSIEAKDDTGIDYDKLIDKYGCFPITP